MIANHSSEMAFSHVRKAFRPIRGDLSKHTTDFILEVQVQCVKTLVARKLSYQKYNKQLFLNEIVFRFRKDIGSPRRTGVVIHSP